ncbi:Uncharacterised protein [Mycobacteroides abscessus]|nr:Uncharacterised protein [Mycobacteroides abscessus]
MSPDCSSRATIWEAVGRETPVRSPIWDRVSGPTSRRSSRAARSLMVRRSPGVPGTLDVAGAVMVGPSTGFRKVY